MSSPRLSQKELAALLGLSTRQARNLVDAGMPVISEGGKLWYDSAACVAWYIGEKEKAARTTEDDGETKEARKRLLLERLELEVEADRMRVAEMRARLVPIADVLKSDERLHGIIRARVTAIRGKWAPRVLGLGTMQEATSTLDEMAADILAALAEGADDMDTDSEQEAA